jgi:hypothetical protein
MPAWDQASGGPLSDQQVADVAAYVPSLSPVAGAAPIPRGPAGGSLGATAMLVILGIVNAIVMGGLVMYY